MFDWFKYRPFDKGFLPEVDGYKIFYQQYGNPKGIPVLVFNGGPGYANDPKRTRYLNFSKHRMIIFDQRGTGNSIHESGNVIYKNTTDDLLDDAKRLIEYLKIERKIASVGVSWGATLALLFAQKYPDVVGRIVAIATFSASAKYASGWFENNAKLFYPDIIAKLTEESKCNNFACYFKDLLFSENESDIKKSVLLYGAYEGMLGERNPSFNMNREVAPWEISRLKIALHYETNEFFLKTNQILNNMDSVKSIPMLMMHNRMDFVCPVEQAWEISASHPKSQLYIAPHQGHGERVMGKMPKVLVGSFLADF